MGMTWPAIVGPSEATTSARWLLGAGCVAVGGVGGGICGLLVGASLITPAVGAFLALVLIGTMII
jgi:hypothetical protein